MLPGPRTDPSEVTPQHRAQRAAEDHLGIGGAPKLGVTRCPPTPHPPPEQPREMEQSYRGPGSRLQKQPKAREVPL